MMDQSSVQDKVLDIAKLHETFMNDAVIKQILSAFQETVASFEEDFKALEKAGDSEQLSRLVHGLKGSAANIRAEKVAKQAAHVQHLIDQGQSFSVAIDELLGSLSQLGNQINLIKAE